MKPIVFFLFFLSILVLPLYAQEDTMIKKMVDVGLVNASDSERIAQCCSKEEKHTLSYLFCLMYLQQDQLRNQSWNGIPTVYKQQGYKLKSKVELMEYIEKLKGIGLIKDRHYNKLKKEVLNGRHNYVETLMASLSMMSESVSKLSPEFLTEFGENMVKANLMTSTSLGKLIQDAEAGEIYSPSQILTYMTDTKIVQYSGYFPDLGHRLESLFRETASILPELEFSDFSYSFKIQVKDEYYAEDTLVVSLKNRGKIYSSVVNYSEQLGRISIKGLLIEHNYYSIFNNILADHQSPLRINSIEQEAEIFSDPISITYGLLLLNYEQCELMQKQSIPFRFRRAGYKNCLTEAKKVLLLNKLDSLGVLDYLSSEGKAALKSKIEKEDFYYYSEIFTDIPDLMYIIPRNYYDSDNPLLKILANLERISHGDFNPRDIRTTENPSNEEKDKLLEFSFKNKKYKVECRSLAQDEGDFDNDLYQFINQILEENQSKGKFYYMNTINEDEGVDTIYLTPDQYEYLKANKFASFDIFNYDLDHHHELDDRY